MPNLFCCKRRSNNANTEEAYLIQNTETGFSQNETLKSLIQDYNLKSKAVLEYTSKSIIRQLLAIIPGAATNAGIYLAITYIAPQFAYAGLIAGNTGALVQAITQQLSGVDGTKGKAASFKTGFELFLNTGPVSEGIRPLGTLITNDTASLVVSTALPAIAQAALANLMSKDREIVQKQKEIKTLLKTIDAYKIKLGDAEFDEVVNSLGDEPSPIYNAMKKNN